MRKIPPYLIIVFMLFGCFSDPKGVLGEECNYDGTCNDSRLICTKTYRGHACVLQEDKTIFETTAFGKHAKKCIDYCGERNIKIFVYTEAAVWRGDPSVCECNR